MYQENGFAEVVFYLLPKATSHLFLEQASKDGLRPQCSRLESEHPKFGACCDLEFWLSALERERTLVNFRSGFRCRVAPG